MWLLWLFDYCRNYDTDVNNDADDSSDYTDNW